MTRRTASVLKLAAVLVLVLGAVFDIGLMPARDAAGGTILVLCSGQGPMQMVMDPVTGVLHPAPSDPRKAGGCDWAGVHTCGLGAMPVALVMFLPATDAPESWTEISWRATGRIGSIWARGPPFPV